MFNLTRSGAPGLQRYAGTWTGDVATNDANIIYGVILMNSLGLSGVPYVGADAGGFFDDTDRDLYTRWVTQAAFTPFFRVHTNNNNRFTEPFVMGESTEAIVADYIKLRYHLMPYTYSHWFKTHKTGLPLMQPLMLQEPFNNLHYGKYQLQYTYGPDLLVVPASSKDKFKKVYFPMTDWYDLHTGMRYPAQTEQIIETNLQTLPVFVKAGSILPTWRLVQTTAHSPGDTLTLHVFAGQNTATFDYYEDDGQTHDYENGKYYLRHITHDSQAKKLTINKPEGSYATQFKKLRVVWHGYGAVPKANVNGATQATFVKQADMGAFKALLGKAPALVTELTNDPISITW